MDVSQYSWKPSFHFVPRCANYQFIDFKFTLPYLLCDNELGSSSISPLEQTVLSFISHQRRELKEYFRRGFFFWFQMSCCILLFLFPVAWSIHGACMGWHLVALCPSFAARMQSLGDLTSLAWTRWPPHCSPFVSCIPGFTHSSTPTPTHRPWLTCSLEGCFFHSRQLRTSCSLSNQKTVIQWTTTILSPTRSALQPSGGVLLLGVSFLGFDLSALGYPLQFSIFS